MPLWTHSRWPTVLKSHLTRRWLTFLNSTMIKRGTILLTKGEMLTNGELSKSTEQNPTIERWLKLQFKNHSTRRTWLTNSIKLSNRRIRTKQWMVCTKTTNATLCLRLRNSRTLRIATSLSQL